MLTSEQLAARKGLITSSVAAGALGVHPWMSPIQAWCRIVGEPVPEPDAKTVERGNLLEPVVLQYPTTIRPWTYVEAPFVRHANGWSGDSADGQYLEKDGTIHVAEAKTANANVGENYGTDWSDDVPDSTFVQGHWHLIHHPQAVSCIVPVLVGGHSFEFRCYELARNSEFHGILLEQLERWHRDYVVTRRPPPADHRDEDWLRRQHPRATETWLPDTPEIEAMVRAKAAWAETRKFHEEREAEAANQLRQMLGTAAGVDCSKYKVTYKNNKDHTKVDWQAICAELNPPQELIQKYTHVSPGARTLRIHIKEQAVAHDAN